VSQAARSILETSPTLVEKRLKSMPSSGDLGVGLGMSGNIQGGQKKTHSPRNIAKEDKFAFIAFLVLRIPGGWLSFAG